MGSANVIYGGLSQMNRDINAEVTGPPQHLILNPQPTLLIGSLEKGKPYVELGYGVENILKFIRVDFIHRLSYLNTPDARKFGILVSFQFDL